MKWLVEIIVCTSFPALEQCIAIGESREQNDRNLGRFLPCLDLAREREPVHVWHHDIANDKRRLPVLYDVERLAPITRESDVAEIAERRRDIGCKFCIVFGDEYVRQIAALQHDSRAMRIVLRK